MKIALAQLNFHVGNFTYNKIKIIEAIVSAKKLQADLVIFPELAICGYPPYDLLEFDSFLEKCNEVVSEIAAYSNDIAVIVGSPIKNDQKQGKPLFNVAIFLEDGRVKSIVKKSLIPDYDIFDEYRYFEPNHDFNVIDFKGYKIAVTICEDIWNITTPFYTLNPLDHLIKQQPDFIVNISASPFSYSHNEKRLKVLSENAIKYRLPLFYINTVGAQTELIFDGGSSVINQDGLLVEQLPLFEENLSIFDLDAVKSVTKPFTRTGKTKTELIYQALILGIRDYFSKSGLPSAILGLSGGIDSAVTAALLTEALGNEYVTGLLLPSPYSSGHSVQDAAQLAENLGIAYQKMAIDEIFSQYLSGLQPFFKDRKADITEENLQARIRAGILMAFSNKFGHILINTSNKSEIAAGYGTLYGDLCGGLSVLGDVYKTEVYELAHYINREKEIIPKNSILKPPSAELKPGQKDTDSLPEYSILDQILFHFIEGKKGIHEIISLGFEEKMVIKIIKMVNSTEYKRFQAAPVLRISEKAFGIGRRIPIVNKFDF